MSPVTTAEVETLTAEVKTLVVGNRQVTLSVYRQLDHAWAWDVEAFGRVNDRGGDDPNRGKRVRRSTPTRRVEVVGRHLKTGALVRCELENHSGLILGDVPWEWNRDHLPLADLTGFETDAGEPLPQTMGEVALDVFDEWVDLPLIVLAGLR
jgi:hypothetical protein